MSPRITNLLLCVALLGCGIYAYQWHSQLQSLQANLEMLKADRDRLSRRVAELKEAKPAPVEPAMEIPEREPSDIGVSRRPAFAPGDTGGPQPDAFRFGGEGRDRFMAMLDNPEIQKLMSIQQKAALDSRFASLFKSLNLSPENLDKFKTLLVEKQTSLMDARAAARAQGLTGPESRDALRQVVANAQAEVDNNIRSTLGEAAFAQYQTYEQTMPERNVVSQLQQRLSYSSSPLSDVQSNQIVALLAANTAGTNPGANVVSGARNNAAQFRTGGVAITDTVIAGSQGVLNSTQIAALTQLQQEQQVQKQIADQLRASRRAAANPAATTGAPTVPGKP